MLVIFAKFSHGTRDMKTGGHRRTVWTDPAGVTLDSLSLEQQQLPGCGGG